jgi:hypothetical protein
VVTPIGRSTEDASTSAADTGQQKPLMNPRITTPSIGALLRRNEALQVEPFDEAIRVTVGRNHRGAAILRDEDGDGPTIEVTVDARARRIDIHRLPGGNGGRAFPEAYRFTR